jgi:pimeloyl-ACP methyl ester carboxylesterase
MTEIVLVHGAWQGAWCWEKVVPLLERAGRVVTAPTLTGSGTRAAELSPGVTLEHHVDDVVAELTDNDRHDVVLVGHSYSGMVITGVAERVPERLAALVFVDAFYPGHGQSALDQMPPPFQNLFRQRAQDEGDGWRLPANDGLLDVWGLHEPELRAWVGSRLTDWSLNCFASPVDAPEMRRRDIPRSYLSGNAENYPAKAAFGPIADRAKADGCKVHTFDTGHDIMLEAPQDFADVLLATTV